MRTLLALALTACTTLPPASDLELSDASLREHVPLDAPPLDLSPSDLAPLDLSLLEGAAGTDLAQLDARPDAPRDALIERPGELPRDVPAEIPRDGGLPLADGFVDIAQDTLPDTASDTASDRSDASEASDAWTTCPAGMVSFPGFCMDRYEAPNEPGAAPLAMQTAVAGALWCAARGRRLCSEAEWLRACQGPRALPFPYGASYVRGRCTDDRTWHGVVLVLLSAVANTATRAPVVRSPRVMDLSPGARNIVLLSKAKVTLTPWLFLIVKEFAVFAVIVPKYPCLA